MWETNPRNGENFKRERLVSFPVLDVEGVGLVMPPIPVGVLNALVNVIVWVVSALCLWASERIYRRVSSYVLTTTGKTHSTDAAEISPQSWLFGYFRLVQRVPAPWVLALLALNVALLPLEILLEAGVQELNNCAPETVNSTGVCASPWEGHSEHGISAAALSIQRFGWVDQEWDYVPVGAAKIPDASEVRTIKQRLVSPEDRRLLVHKCRVDIAGCSALGCGEMTIFKSNGTFDTITTNWTYAPRNVKLTGDLTYDQSTALAFLFWPTRTVPDAMRARYNGTVIHVRGVERLLTDGETQRVLRGEREPWQLRLDAVRTRSYDIRCHTDGLTALDLSSAVSLYRTVQMEQPGVRRNEVQGVLARLSPLNSSDIAKAAFAIKSEDWSDECIGTVEKYRECGGFQIHFVTPFFGLSACIVVGWIAVALSVRNIADDVPVSAVEWRERAMSSLGRGSPSNSCTLTSSVLELSHLDTTTIDTHFPDQPNSRNRPRPAPSEEILGESFYA